MLVPDPGRSDLGADVRAEPVPLLLRHRAALLERQRMRTTTVVVARTAGWFCH